jgi:hypothetical protein
MMTTTELRRTAKAYDEIAAASNAAIAKHGDVAAANAMIALLAECQARLQGLDLDEQFAGWLAVLRQEGKLK